MEGFATNWPNINGVFFGGYFTPFITGRGPPCMGEINLQEKNEGAKACDLDIQ